MDVTAESAGAPEAEVGVDPAHVELHHGAAMRGRAAPLDVDAEVAKFFALRFDELFRLHDHAAGAVHAVANASLVDGEPELGKKAKVGSEVLVVSGRLLGGRAYHCGYLTNFSVTDPTASSLTDEAGSETVARMRRFGSATELPGHSNFLL